MKIGDSCWMFIDAIHKKSTKKLVVGWIIGRDLMQPHKFKIRFKNKIYTKTIAQIAKISPKDKELIIKELKKY